MLRPDSQKFVDQLQSASTEANVAALRVVLAGQWGELVRNTVVKEHDSSLLTDVDSASEQAGNEVWAQRTGLPSLGEEMGLVGGDEARVIGMRDPIDGTRPFVIGAHTSTTMSGAYDLKEKRFIASSVAHPASLEIVDAWNGQSRFSRLQLTENDFELTDSRDLEVWDGPLGGSTVLVDNFAPFARGKGEQQRTITTPQRIVDFLGGLLDVGAVPQGYGSNGYHQMLLAKGREKLAGAVMLSQGGAWDAIGLLAVENGGGSARAFQVSESGKLSERHPHDPFNWDILVLGNNPRNCDTITNAVEQAFN